MNSIIKYSIIAAISAACPKSDTGTIALVFGVIFASIKFGSILYVLSSISTNTGFAPKNAIISAVAIKVKGVVMISSPGFISSAIKANSSASVPLLQAIACFAPLNLARFSSSSPTLPPI